MTRLVSIISLVAELTWSAGGYAAESITLGSIALGAGLLAGAVHIAHAILPAE